MTAPDTAPAAQVTDRSVLQLLYNNEIDVEISSFWDGGWIARIGDQMNGFRAEGSFETITEVEKWLLSTALTLYADSDFARHLASTSQAAVADGDDAGLVRSLILRIADDMRHGRDKSLKVLAGENDILTRLADLRATIARQAEEIARQPVLSVAADAVISERSRQVLKEGWTREHDDLHVDGEIGAAGACYALSGTGWTQRLIAPLTALWPWSLAWWKPTTPRQDLVKAGALIIAEIERLDRAEIARLKGGAL